jgi:hypothetical protein
MPEHQHIEWKETWRDEYMRQLCGFANADGGTPVIGRNNKGRPVGVANAHRLLEDLPNKIRDILGIIPDLRLVTDAGRDFVEIRNIPDFFAICKPRAEGAFQCSPGQRPGYLENKKSKALKGRPESYHNPLPVYRFISFSAPKTATASLMTRFAICCTLTWRPCFKISNVRISTVELAAALNMGLTNTDKHLKVMREAGCIRRVGPAKGGRWEVIL